MKKTLRKISTAFIWMLALVSFVTAQNGAVVIKNALVIDGSGKKAVRADVRFKNGKIVKIGSIRPKIGEEIMDAGGKILAPGFIDIHNHSESGLLREGAAANQVSQGITTIAVGPDGGSPFPIAEYFAKLEGRIAPNVLSFIGHATVRERVLGGDYIRRATD